MAKTLNETSLRKKEHIELCLTDEVSFRTKTNGFDKYEFIHYAITEVDIQQISFHRMLFSKSIQFPFLISSMTGGTEKAELINQRLAVIAEEMKIPIGVGSQRQALESNYFHNTYKIIRKSAPSVPVLGNIGAAQLVQSKDLSDILSLIEMLEADALIIHFNPLQELLQENGETHFVGVLNKIEKLCKQSLIPIIAKEVGSGIGKEAAVKLLDCGVSGIDVAGAGGTSWAGVEILRSKNVKTDFWDWGLPASYCLKEIFPLKEKYNFILIGSGGINTADDFAKTFAFGSDVAASARIILQKLLNENDQAVKDLILSWVDYLKKIMFLTGSNNLDEFKRGKVIKKEELF